MVRPEDSISARPLYLFLYCHVPYTRGQVRQYFGKVIEVSMLMRTEQTSCKVRWEGQKIAGIFTLKQYNLNPTTRSHRTCNGECFVKKQITSLSLFQWYQALRVKETVWKCSRLNEIPEW